MEGWTEEEIQNKDLMAPCGLYCGACGIYIAARNGPWKNVNATTALPAAVLCSGDHNAAGPARNL